MKTYRVTTKSGYRVNLISDDNFTLALGPGRDGGGIEETTPEWIAGAISLRSLLYILAKEPAQRYGKLGEAIAIATGCREDMGCESHPEFVEAS